MWVQIRVGQDGTVARAWWGDAPAVEPVDYPLEHRSVALELPASWFTYDQATRELRLLPDFQGVLSAINGLRDAVTAANPQGAVRQLRAEVAQLDALVRPLFQTPDAPTEAQHWDWRNLLTFWQWVPGTFRPRVLLTLWEFKNWWLIGVVMWVLGSWFPWYGFSALGLLGCLTAFCFGVHEVLFRWWGRTICRLEEVDPTENAMKFTSTFERFVSRYIL